MMNTSKATALIGYAISSCLFLGITFCFTGTFGSFPGAEMAVWLLTLYFIAPVSSFVTAIFFGLNNACLKWLYPLIFGAWGFAIPCIASGNIRYDTISLFFSLVPALLGLIIGSAVRKIRKRSV